MSRSKLGFCEIWLSTENGKYRVSCRCPDDVEVPTDFLCAIPKGEQKRVCVSKWYSTLHEARDRAVSFQDHLRQRGHKVMFFFEIRLPIVGNLHTGN